MFICMHFLFVFTFAPSVQSWYLVFWDAAKSASALSCASHCHHCIPPIWKQRIWWSLKWGTSATANFTPSWPLPFSKGLPGRSSNAVTRSQVVHSTANANTTDVWIYWRYWDLWHVRIRRWVEVATELWRMKGWCVKDLLLPSQLAASESFSCPSFDSICMSQKWC